jgi:glycosyltransferase involved in cell wall biosynthesis
MTTLAVAMITLGEPSLEAAVASVRTHVDQVVIIYTGTSDERWEQVRALADVAERFAWVEDFAKARQLSFDLATAEACLWIDTDDEVVNGHLLREVVDTAPAGASLVKLPYDYLHDPVTGACTCTQWRERIARPASAFAWQYAVHEVLEPATAPTNLGESDAVRIVHKRKDPPDHARNMRILRRCLAENPDDARSRFYLGLALFDAGDLAQAERELERFLDQQTVWPDERVMALLRLSWAARERGDADQSIARAKAAHQARPWDICCFEVARAYASKAERLFGKDELLAWEQCAFWARAGLATAPAKTGLWQNPIDRPGLIHCTLQAALGHLGDIDGAAESAAAALSVLPGEARVRANLLVYEAAIAGREQLRGQQRAAKAAAEAERLFAAGDVSRSALAVVRAEGGLPPRPKGPQELDIVFACGDAIEAWNPIVMAEQGIGGSEQAVVHMAAGLAGRGHRVRVYTNSGPVARVHGGVEYLPSDEIGAAGGCDVLVGWRDASSMEVVKARARLLWAHDTSIANCTEWRLHLADRVMCLSDWHRECLAREHPEIPPEKFYKTRNGIDLALFDQTVERDPGKAIFSSSPSRGLGVLLGMWPEIRERAIALGAKAPSIHIFYGFDSWHRLALMRGDTRQVEMIEALTAKMKEQEPLGVVYRGRVPPRVLAREMLGAGAWLYPSWDDVHGEQPWFETSCCSAMESQAAGLRIVTLAAGALPETMGGAGVLIDDDPRSGIGREEFVQASVLALTPGATADQVAYASDERRRGWYTREYAQEIAIKRFGWAPVVRDWEKLMRDLVKRA